MIFISYSFIRKKVESKRIGYLFLVCFWISFEKMHLEWELSWPWLNLGNGFSNQTEWIQWYEYTGSLGGTLWVWCVNIGFMNSIRIYHKNQNKLIFYKNILINIGIIFFLIFISNYIYITYTNENKKTADVFILQPNIDPYHEKYKISTGKLIIKIKNLIDKKKYFVKKTFIIAPETTLPGFRYGKISINKISKNKLISIFKKSIKKYPNSVFITGIESYSLYSNKEKKSKTSIPIFFKNRIQWLDIFNSIIQIGNSNDISIHHKYKLVPGVETFPYKKFLYPILGNILLNFGGIVMEHGKQNIQNVFVHPDLDIKIAPIICYESVFGEYVSKFFRKNADFIVIITNDGWWGFSQGHKQHLYYARLRAIENRKYIARSANTGVSCVINEKGEIISSLPYGKEGVLSHKIFLNRKKTFYIKNGDLFFKASFFTCILILVYTIGYRLILR